MGNLTLLVFTCTLFALVGGMSWTSKERRRDFLIDTVRDNIKYDWIEPCEDEMTGPSCDKLERKGLCSRFRIVRKKCKSTCGECSQRPPSPPNCGITKYGCCWDNITIASGENFEGCAKCEDKYPECKIFREQCSSRPDIRRICPVTCQVGCEKQCLDNKYQAEVCVIYRKYNFCSISPALMMKMCAKTCGFCKSRTIWRG